MSKKVWVKGHYRGQTRSKSSKPEAERGGCLVSIFKALLSVIFIAVIVSAFSGKDDVNAPPATTSHQGGAPLIDAPAK